MILEITKQKLIMITMCIVWVFDVKKIENELSGPFAEVGAPQSDNYSNNLPKIFHKICFFPKSFDWNTPLSYCKLYI